MGTLPSPDVRRMTGRNPTEQTMTANPGKKFRIGGHFGTVEVLFVFGTVAGGSRKSKRG